MLVFLSFVFFPVLIQSLQMPVLALMRDIVTSANTTHFNLSELIGGLQLAIGSTLQAAQQVCHVLSTVGFARLHFDCHSVALVKFFVQLCSCYKDLCISCHALLHLTNVDSHLSLHNFYNGSFFRHFQTPNIRKKAVCSLHLSVPSAYRGIRTFVYVFNKF